MPVPPIKQCRQRIHLETLSKPINGGRMERERRSPVGLLYRVPFLEISQDLVFRSAALGRGRHCWRHRKGPSGELRGCRSVQSLPEFPLAVYMRTRVVAQNPGCMVT